MVSKHTFMLALLTISSIISAKENPLTINIKKTVAISSLFDNKTLQYLIHEEIFLDNHEQMNSEEIFTAGYHNGFDDALEGLNQYCTIVVDEEMDILREMATEYLDNLKVIEVLKEENDELLAMNGASVITGYVFGIISGGLLSYIISLRSQLSAPKQPAA